MKFINIGYGNMVASERVVALVSPESAPVKRLVQDAKEHGRTVDVSCGRKTRSVIVTDSEHVILSALAVGTIAARLGVSAEDLGDAATDDSETEG